MDAQGPVPGTSPFSINVPAPVLPPGSPSTGSIASFSNTTPASFEIPPHRMDLLEQRLTKPRPGPASPAHQPSSGISTQYAPQLPTPSPPPAPTSFTSLPEKDKGEDGIKEMEEDEPLADEGKIIVDENSAGKPEGRPKRRRTTAAVDANKRGAKKAAAESSPLPPSVSAPAAIPQSPAKDEKFPSMEAELKAAKEELAKFKERENNMAQREEQVKKAWEMFSTKKAQEDQNIDEYKRKVMEVMVDLLRKQTIRERQEARNRMTANSVRLGHIVYERHGPNVSEVWQDGYAFKELRARKEQIEVQREELEKLKKQQSKKKTGKGDKVIDAMDQEEMYKFRIMTLKKESEDMQVEAERLQSDKDLHIRELKRLIDEDRSRFNSSPILNGKAFDLANFREVACKIHQLNTQWNDLKKQNYTKHATREYEIHKSLSHPKVVRLFDVFEIDENAFCTVLEYCDGTDLDFYLKTHKMLSEKEARAIIVQLLAGLKYLNDQKQSIIHYDLKPGNILFHRGEVKITDFGLSKMMDENQDMMDLTSQGAGTYWYLPPECFETSAPKISPKVDVWSAGVIFYQMLYGKKPFGNNLSQQKLLVDRVISSDLKVEFPPKPVVTPAAKDFIRLLLTPRQDQRPDINSCLAHAYILKPKKEGKEGKDKDKEAKDRDLMPPPPPPDFLSVKL